MDIAHFHGAGFGAGQKIYVRELDQSERGTGKNIARERRIGPRALHGDRIVVCVFEVNGRTNHIPVIFADTVRNRLRRAWLGREGLRRGRRKAIPRRSAHADIAKKCVRLAVVEPAIDVGIRLRSLILRGGIAKHRIDAVQRIQLE